MTTQPIVPHLWFDTQALEAAEFYASFFPDSRINGTTVLRDTPSGDCDIVSFTLWGQRFEAISGGPHFTLNPSISFIVNFDPLFFGMCDSAKTVAMETQSLVWESLCEGGTVMMSLDAYPFSERYGFVMDRYGVSWQLILTRPEGERRPPIVPAMMFTQANCGKAEEALNFYLSVFRDSTLGGLLRHGPEQGEFEGSVMFSDFAVGDYFIALVDSPGPHEFTFNEALSFMVYCKDQAEVDYYWDKLNATPGGGQCGWLQDKYGVSWQVVPAVMHDMMYSATPEQLARVIARVLTMKKLDIAPLQRAFNGD